jgi:D-glycero-D-manno-heptose 1,7-bisphosphate phosphatase
VWIEGAREAVKLLKDTGYWIFVVTNQAGIARGLYGEADVEGLHTWINGELAPLGCAIDAFYFCPHHPEAGSGPYTRECDCRKPLPGMLLRAMAEFPVERQGSFLVGDRPTDLEAARAAGIPGHLFTGGDLYAFIRRLAVRSAP